VDDEREFVQTLSERLKMRQFASEIAYNGQEALDFTDEEDTEVIILDLKMPGIDGIEVLKKMKATKPDIEVIILTGHGSEADRKTCLDLGAFAYLQKPADIDLITETMKQAYKKIESRKSAGPLQ
jgi:two-component system, OmpR family, response regulator CpxR